MRVSFNTKVLVPALGVMAGLVALTLWIVHVRIQSLVRAHATDSLRTSAAVLDHFQGLRLRDLLARARNLTHEPRFRAVAQLAEPKTTAFLLKELVEELNLDLVALWGADASPLASAGSAAAAMPALSAGVDAVLRGESRTELRLHGDLPLQLVLLPVQVGTSQSGVLAFGRVLDSTAAAEYRALLGCDIAFCASGRPVLTTFPSGLDEMGPIAAPDGVPRGYELDGTHYLGVARRPSGGSAEPGLSYLLLASYEPQLQSLRRTQGILLSVGALGLLLGGLATGLAIRQATRPLALLQAGAEAIGRGDFAHRVQVPDQGEFHDLADAFNQMAANLQGSREKLENTVATLRDTRARLLQTEKLSALGEFISGITHELNSPLTIMIGYAEMLGDSVADPTQRADIQGIAEAARRCHKIVQNLLSFARQHPVERSLLDLNALLTGSVGFLYHELRTGNIDVQQDLDPALPRVLADPHQLQQVLLNLINNARQAIGDARGRGRIRLATSAHGDRVRIEVSDDGPGMSPEVLARVFDPFFTTKPVGKGTGLGLSVSFGIVREHGGEITARGAPGQGAVFTIELPAGARDPADGSGRVLVVDDEEGMRAYLTRTLRAAGYAVEAAADGRAALDILAAGGVDLVLSDWKMPGMDGLELYRAIQRSHPTLARRFILVSGDVLNDRLDALVRDENLAHCPKPFHSRHLLALMARVLEPGPA